MTPRNLAWSMSKIMESDRVARRLSKIMYDEWPTVHRADLRKTLDCLAEEARHMH